MHWAPKWLCLHLISCTSQASPRLMMHSFWKCNYFLILTIYMHTLILLLFLNEIILIVSFQAFTYCFRVSQLTALNNYWWTVCIITPKSYHTLEINENIPIHTYDCIQCETQTCNIPITCPKLIGNMLRCNQYCNNFDECRFQWMVDMQSKFSI